MSRPVIFTKEEAVHVGKTYSQLVIDYARTIENNLAYLATMGLDVVVVKSFDYTYRLQWNADDGVWHVATSDHDTLTIPSLFSASKWLDRLQVEEFIEWLDEFDCTSHHLAEFALEDNNSGRGMYGNGFFYVTSQRKG